MKIPGWLRCLRLHVRKEGEYFDMTCPVGRVLLKGRDRWGGDDYMLYWLKLPSFVFDYAFEYDRPMWQQRVLFFHGREGFSVRPIVCRDHEPHEQA